MALEDFNNNEKQTDDRHKEVKQHGRKLNRLVLGFVLLAVIGGVIWLFASGRVYIGVKDPTENVSVSTATNICKSLVDEYAEASSTLGADFDQYGKIAEIYQKIPDNADAVNDPNCEFIKMYVSMNTGEQEQALEHAKKIKALQNEGASIDTRLPIFGSIDDTITMLEASVNDDIDNSESDNNNDLGPGAERDDTAN
jgi:hypothetical protein